MAVDQAAIALQPSSAVGFERDIVAQHQFAARQCQLQIDRAAILQRGAGSDAAGEHTVIGPEAADVQCHAVADTDAQARISGSQCGGGQWILIGDRELALKAQTAAQIGDVRVDVDARTLNKQRRSGGQLQWQLSGQLKARIRIDLRIGEAVAGQISRRQLQRLRRQGHCVGDHDGRGVCRHDDGRCEIIRLPIDIDVARGLRRPDNQGASQRGSGAEGAALVRAIDGARLQAAIEDEIGGGELHHACRRALLVAGLVMAKPRRRDNLLDAPLVEGLCQCRVDHTGVSQQRIRTADIVELAIGADELRGLNAATQIGGRAARYVDRGARVEDDVTFR